MTLKELKREIDDGAIVAVSTALGQRMSREELVAVAMPTWEQSVIEDALGADAPAVLPEAIRLVELRARVIAPATRALHHSAEKTCAFIVTRRSAPGSETPNAL